MCTKYFSGCLAAMVLLGSLVLPMKSVEAAEKTVVYDDTATSTDKGSGFGKSSGFGFSIPSGSADYTIRVYVDVPSNFGSSRLTFKLISKANDYTYDETVLYDEALPVGMNGWIDMPAIPSSQTGNPYLSYNWFISSGTVKTPTTRTLRLQVYHQDVTPPTVPKITPNNFTNINSWSAAPILETIDGSMDDAGIARYVYRIDGGGEQTYTSPVQMPEGAHTIEAMSYDNNGLSSGWSSVGKTYYAPNPPTAPVITRLPSGWTNQDVTFNITPGTDAVAGILSTDYMLSGSTTTDWIQATQGTISSEGIYTITARTTNMARTSNSTEATVYMDKTAPIGTLTAPHDWAKSVTIHATGTDALSGVQSITLPSGNVVKASEADYIATVNGTFSFTFTDMAGNTSTKSIVIRNVDITAPSEPNITASIATSSENWSSAPIEITIDGSTDDSGIARYAYRIDDGEEQPYTGSFNAPKGSHQIYAKAYDNTGYNSGWSMEGLNTYYAPDPPTAPVLNGLPSGWTNQDVPFTITPGTDNVAGIVSTEYQLNNGTWMDKVKGLINQEGVTTITVRSTNKAGITSSTEDKVYVDKTPPNAQLSLADTGWTKATSIQAVGTDLLSGIDHIVLPDGKGIKDNSINYPVTANGDYIFKFLDQAGNETCKTITVDHIDHTPPVIETSAVDSTWTDQPRTISYRLSDAGSGLDTNNMYYQWSDSDQTPTTWTQLGETNGSLTQSQPGIWYLHVQAADQLGNVSQQVVGPYRIQSKPQIPMLTVIGTATDKMLLSWSLPTGDINVDGLKYRIRNETTGRSWTVDYPTNTLLDTSLVGGADYSYTITAINHVGSSAASTSVIGVTLPQAPTGASIYAKDTDYHRALVSVAPVPSATAYRIRATNWSTEQVDADITVTGNVYQEITGLKPYTMYDFSVAAINESGEGAAYHTSFLSLPDQINGFKSAQITENSIDLKWNSVTRAVYDWSSVSNDTYYQLRRDNQIIYTGNFPSYQDVGLQSGTPYNYDAQAGNSTGWGSKATLDQIWTLPSAPRSLRQVQATTNSFTVQLETPKGATGFQAKVDGQIVANLGSVLSQYTFIGYKPGTTHTLELSAYNSSGIGKSTSVIVSTLPEIPTDGAITVSDIQADRVTFNVYEVLGATKYKIKINGNEYEVAAGETTISGLQSGTEYDYSFAAGNAAGYGADYTGHILTLPSTPANYQMTERTPTAVSFTWASVKGANVYEVLDSAGKLVATVQTPEYKMSGLLPGSTTRINVRAVNASGPGASSAFGFRTLPGFSDDLINYSKLVHVDDVGLYDAHLSWLAVPGADQYDVYDAHQQLIAQTTERNVVIDQLSSATLYADYSIVPINNAGEGTAMSVPNWVTLPDNTMTISHESTRNSITLHLQHNLTAETLVIASAGKELYRGKAEGYTEFVQSELSPDALYTFKVWTENSAGQVSKVQVLKIYTNKERVTKPETSSTPETQPIIDEPVQPEQTLTPSTISEDQKDKKKGFIDIDRSFAKASITRLADLGIVQGISDDLYAPSVGTTRAEFMALLTRLTLTPEQIKQTGENSLSFEDVDSEGWYMPELRAAIQHGIAKGFSMDRFAPDEAIDREQAAKMLANALQTTVSAADTFYTDADAVSPWAQNDVNGLTAKRILEGYPDQTFRPHATLTRAESAAMIDRALQQGMIYNRIK